MKRYCCYGAYADAGHDANCPGTDPLIAVIDHQLEIERKARAWDMLRSRASGQTADEMDTILANA